MRASELLKKLKDGQLTSLLKTIYIEKIEYQIARYSEALESYIDYFGDKDVNIFSVPGKCELGGNNTDHQHGQVLAMATHLDSIAIVGKKDRQAKVIYNQLNINEIDTDNLAYNEAKTGTLESLITGVLFGLKQHSYKVGGFDAYIQSDIPRNVGLGSSANIEIMIGTIINHLYNNGSIEDMTIIQIGRFSNNVFYGKPSGLMNECVCCLGGFMKIDFKNLSKPVVKQLDIDLTNFNYALCVVNSNASRNNYSSEYNTIPDEMTKVAHYFKKDVLREVDYDTFIKNYKILRARVGDRAALRALHFFKEEKRVIQQEKALESGDFKTFLELVKKSGESSFKLLQNIYPMKDPMHQNMGTALVLTENFLEGDGITKVNGGGFSGTILTLVKKDRLEEYKKYMDTLFGKTACFVIHTRMQGAIKLM